MKSLLYTLCIFLLVFLFSCKTEQNILMKSDAISSVLTDENKFEFKYNFFEANKYMLIGEFDKAISLFHTCLNIDSTSSVSYYKLATIYLYKKEYVLAEDFAQKALLYNDTNIWYLYLAGNLFLQNKEYNKAIATFNQLIGIDESELDFYLNLADVYIQKNDFKGALKVYASIEKKFGISEVISMQVSKILMSQGKFKEALAELNKLANSNEYNVTFQRNIADFYLQTNNIDKAISSYSLIISNFPDDGYSYLGLAESYRAKGLLKESFDMIKKAFYLDDIPSEIKLNLLFGIIQNMGNDTDTKIVAIELTEILLKLYPDDADVNTIYSNFLLQANDLLGAKNYLQKVLSVRKDKYAIWEQLVLVYNQLQDWKSCYQITKEAIGYFPNQSFFYFFNGFSSFQLEKFDEALDSFLFGFKLITKSDPLFKDYLTFIGESYHKVGNNTKAYETFDRLIEIDSQNLMVLNNYAYYLSVDNKDLTKAEKMSRITIDKESTNATYLDTYAWILFKQKNYSEALIFIEKALENDLKPSDIVVEHYGDILYFNKKIDEAVIQWNRAIMIGNGSGLLRKKIDAKKYFD